MAGTRQFDEACLLDKALDLFWKQGYHATSMIDLAKATEVQRGSLYNAYGNKENLFLKAFENYSDRLVDNTEKALDKPTLKQAITDFFISFSERLCAKDNGRGCFSTKVIMEATHSDEIVTEQLVILLNRLEQLLEKRLELSKKSGEFTGDCRVTARYLVALTRGMAVIERAYKDPQRIKEIYCAAIVMLQLD